MILVCNHFSYLLAVITVLVYLCLCENKGHHPPLETKAGIFIFKFPEDKTIDVESFLSKKDIEGSST